MTRGLGSARGLRLAQRGLRAAHSWILSFTSLGDLATSITIGAIFSGSFLSVMGRAVRQAKQYGTSIGALRERMERIGKARAPEDRAATTRTSLDKARKRVAALTRAMDAGDGRRTNSAPPLNDEDIDAQRVGVLLFDHLGATRRRGGWDADRDDMPAPASATPASRQVKANGPAIKYDRDAAERGAR